MKKRGVFFVLCLMFGLLLAVLARIPPMPIERSTSVSALDTQDHESPTLEVELDAPRSASSADNIGQELANHPQDSGPALVLIVTDAESKPVAGAFVTVDLYPTDGATDSVVRKAHIDGSTASNGRVRFALDEDDALHTRALVARRCIPTS
jgi:hypothetical protein